MSIPFLRPGARRGGPLAPAAAPPPPPPPRGPQAAPTAPAPAPRAWRLSSFSAPFPTLVFAPPLRPQREGRRRTSGPARPPPSLPPSRFRPPAAPSAAAQPQNIAQKQPAPPPNEGTPASPGTRPPRRAAHKSRPLTHAHGERRLPKNTRAACFPPPAPVWPLHNAGTGGGNRPLLPPLPSAGTVRLLHRRVLEPLTHRTAQPWGAHGAPSRPHTRCGTSHAVLAAATAGAAPADIRAAPAPGWHPFDWPHFPRLLCPAYEPQPF